MIERLHIQELRYSKTLSRTSYRGHCYDLSLCLGLCSACTHYHRQYLIGPNICILKWGINAYLLTTEEEGKMVKRPFQYD
uniref:Uncharacterized protein n=1 Tax=Anguilla anguilla TaxID=7936 RepID=A0A0E9X6K7_ANGAN